MSALKKERVEYRVTAEEKLALEEAAILSSTTVSRFISETMAQKVEAVILERKRLLVSHEQWKNVMFALENPPEPTELMKEIFGSAMEETWKVTVNR
ncbi:type II toxin-antitoxin system TacA family antitoxin [Candidatus Enterovibrio escicola]|uniref:DUF1778 domain-containing protein n=1 Tax=Candidatus Enterovibrio escicola TaxID=1927127 RepID=A0A2A5T4A0_9GAMM|nr:DUF1778 domain-containing protein [Candidatus Enterovibrio escacola]PCS22997.1 hypothetical protein BTN49_1557 [Candidatus Enterovibrio escacola]